ncbi:hypothetical protein J7L00_04260 [Candidatus Bathyarchaeota archaeon]|nr:hypothetical protein [Candidatus Bathyarchaeota archaeon]
MGVHRYGGLHGDRAILPIWLKKAGTSQLIRVEAELDSGASITVFPSNFLKIIEHEPTAEIVNIVSVFKEIEPAPVSYVPLIIEGVETVLPSAFSRFIDIPLISVDDLTEAGFMVSFHRDYFEIYHV